MLLALGLLSIALLALIGQATLLAQSSQKTDDSAVAFDIAQSILERLGREATLDQPPTSNETAWLQNDPIGIYRDGTETVAFTDYEWEVRVTDVSNVVSSAPLGTGPTGVENEGTKLKRFDIKVEWWGGEAAERTNTGKLRVETTRLIKVTRANP